MARQKISDQVETLRQQTKDLADKLKQAEIRAKAEAKTLHQRKCEIAGAVALAEWEANPSGEFGAAFQNLLREKITKAGHRQLFGLEPLQKPAEEKTEADRE